MNKRYAGLLAIIVLASSAFFSCKNNSSLNLGSLEFDSVYVSEKAHLFSDTAKPACDITVNFAYVLKSSDKGLKDSLNALLQTLCLDSQYAAMKSEEAVRIYKENYIADYRKDLEPMYRQDLAEQEETSIAPWYSYYKRVKGYVRSYSNDLLVYQVDYDEYTGGAHGIYMSSFHNIDLSTITPLSLEDLFIADFKEPLTDLLWNQLMADNRVTTREELEDIGYASTGELEPVENFYLRKKGICFYYNVYEITPYAMGPTEIMLPYEAIEHLLSEKGKAYMNYEL